MNRATYLKLETFDLYGGSAQLQFPVRQSLSWDVCGFPQPLNVKCPQSTLK